MVPKNADPQTIWMQLKLIRRYWLDDSKSGFTDEETLMLSMFMNNLRKHEWEMIFLTWFLFLYQCVHISNEMTKILFIW